MRFLLFFLCSLFSGIFYVFGNISGNTKYGITNLNAESFSGNLFIESGIFLVLWILLFFYFSSKFPNTPLQHEIDESQEEESSLNLASISHHTRTFFRKYLYYIGFIFFYVSLYLIFVALGWSFSYCVFFLNLLVFCLYFLTDKFYIFKDFIKINTILFSLIYLLFYIAGLSWVKESFTIIDFINNGAIITLFLIFLSIENSDGEQDTWLVSYFCFYILVSGVFYVNYIFSIPLVSLALVSFTLGTILFFVPEYTNLLSNNKKVLRYVSLIFLYTSILSSMGVVMIYGMSFIPLTILLTNIWFQFSIHEKYENYVSLFFSFLSFFFLYSYTFFQVFYVGDHKNTLLLINFLLLSFSFIGYSYVHVPKYYYDTYAIIVFAYIVNIFWVTLFFILSGFNILTVWLVLMIESFFVFSSYYKLNNTYGYDTNSK